MADALADAAVPEPLYRRMASWDYWRPVVECRALVDAEPIRVDGNDGISIRLCRRFRGHFRRCNPDQPRRSYLRTYYETNRNVWPDMSRRAALLDAAKLTRRVFRAR